MLDNLHIIFFSSEPFKFREFYIGKYREKGKLPPKIMRMIYGKMAPWHGSRMTKGLSYLRQAATETK